MLIAIPITFFLLLPVSNVFAEEVNLLEGKVLTKLHSTVLNIELATDGDINTAANLGYHGSGYPTLKAEYVFDTPQNIKSVYFKGYDFTLEFLNESNVVINTIKMPYNTLYQANVDINRVKKVRIHAMNSNYNYLYEIKLFANAIKYLPISNLSATKTHEESKLSWTNPNEVEFTGITIHKDGVKIADLPKSNNSFNVTGLSAETNYNFDVFAKYSDGGSSPPVSINVKTAEKPPTPPPPKPAGEIIDLLATAEYNRVNLTWGLPGSTNFKHVNIYRNTITKTSVIDILTGTKVYAASTEIFETNGTYFNDLTVQPETTYEYKLTTTSTEGAESDGVMKTVTTPKKPVPEIIGGEHEKDPTTGDYTYSWTEPKTGKVKIIVGGNLYKTVNASDLQIRIPTADMKYTLLGAPDVSLIPVDEEGTEGIPVKPPSVDGGGGGIEDVRIPITPNDVLGTGTGLFWLIGPFVILALAFLLVPKLRRLIYQTFGGKKAPGTVGANDSRRFTSDTGETRTEREKVIREREIKEPRERVIRERTFKAPRERKADGYIRHMRTPRASTKRERPTRGERGLS